MPSYLANKWCLFVCLLSLLSFFPLFAFSEESTVPPSESHPIITEIETLQQQLLDTLDAEEALAGEEQIKKYLDANAVNEKLRDAIEKAITLELADKQILLDAIAFQQADSADAFAEAPSLLNEIADDLYAAESQDKLSFLGEYNEILTLFDSIFVDTSENIIWLQRLGEDTAQETLAFNQVLLKRLNSITTTLKFLEQERRIYDVKFDVAPDKEKSLIEVEKVILTYRVEMLAKSLNKIIKVADKQHIDTTAFRVFHFETTREITKELFSISVIKVIFQHSLDAISEFFTEHLAKLFIQILIIVFIVVLTYYLSLIAKRSMTKLVASDNIDIPQLMKDFLVSMTGRLIFLIGFVVALSQLGIDFLPILTGFGIAGVIVGFALQDTLSNFASGMMLLIYRPFDVGDFVSAGGVEGKVGHMSLVNTTIRTFDNQIIIIPNNSIWGNVIKNMTHERVRRVDMTFNAGYGDSSAFVKQTLQDIVDNHPSILRSPKAIIKLEKLGASSVEFIVRPWVKTDDYWDVLWDITWEVKEEFEKKGITIPYPQHDVHLHKSTE
ncbi:mechanosensitive ion channel family protein [Enterovibrio sp. ZSDZ42]|uniref:Small-conductance mechanosensitive channel n=1 Tax=Enterovibrio gelatinilyticus TaxID=2899819 RepID=A0ABT5R2P8_9GAMM|nr:mechanosensitive ion channel family protein [Enterovibrio sp. ZSDZ42]MDD1794538.1 mechanosensitive ion channel family protein [Enterovibrio sp. ZSDZ42]